LPLGLFTVTKPPKKTRQKKVQKKKIKIKAFSIVNTALDEKL